MAALPSGLRYSQNSCHVSPRIHSRGILNMMMMMEKQRAAEAREESNDYRLLPT